MADVERPDPGAPPPEGCYWDAIPAGRHWRLQAGKRCRSGASAGHSACGAPSVAALNRGAYGHRENWWTYCSAHLYGRWIEDGQVMQWVAREIDGENT